MLDALKSLAVVAVGSLAGWFGPERPADAVHIPAGPALLGGAGYSSMAGPARFNLKGFYIDRFEVSNARYKAFTKVTGHSEPAFFDDPEFNRPDQPVTGVSRDDAESFCKWAGGRLPTEIEWEKAARGTDGRKYPWGNAERLDFAYLKGEAPAAIGSHPGDISPYGVMDMAGNVSEWVSDFRVAGNVCVPGFVQPADSRLQMRGYLRGNNFQGLPHMTRLHHRLWDYSDTVSEFFGFRCVYPEKQ